MGGWSVPARPPYGLGRPRRLRRAPVDVGGGPRPRVARVGSGQLHVLRACRPRRPRAFGRYRAGMGRRAADPLAALRVRVDAAPARSPANRIRWSHELRGLRASLRRALAARPSAAGALSRPVAPAGAMGARAPVRARAAPDP